MKQFIDKLISRLEERVNVYSSGYGCMSCEVRAVPISEVKKAVNQLAEEYKGGWIPCSKELPVWHDNVLVCTERGGRTIASMRLTENDWYDMYDTKIENVIAWMPLPEPYQKEGE